MNLKRICYIIPLFILFSCNNTEQKQDTKTDNNEQANQIDTAAVQKELNKYLIEPPKEDYTGDYVTKWENGNTKFKGFFRFGKRHGQWVAFYASGPMWSECFYDKGLKHGSNSVYFENGKLRYTGWFKNDMRDSLWVFYDEFGVEQRRIWFKNDEEVTLSK